VLFAGSIQENIKYKFLNATLGQVKEAASVANASKFIE
jgi:ABC-type multidrug transport system fused ATPase/permease subunit